MASDMMDIEELSQYIHRDQREVAKLASRGQLPGHKVGGEWRFARVEINHWLEMQMPGLSESQLSALETRALVEHSEPLVSGLLPVECMAVPLPATTRASVLKELLNLAEKSWHVFDAEALLVAIRHREGLASTALPSGVAIPHPHRPLPSTLGDSVLAYGRTASAIPFGAEDGSLTDIFFLVCGQDESTHLRVLARLSRLLLRPGFVDALRGAETAAETARQLRAAEEEILGSVQSRDR